LSARTRDTAIDKPLYANSIVIKEPTFFNFPKAQSFNVSNGLKGLYYNNQNGIPKINVIIEFKARPFYDSLEKPGLYSFVMDMLSEGTKKYTASQLAQEIESRGMSFNAGPGSVSMTMIASDLEKGLELLKEILTNATFNQNSIEKVRDQIEADIKNFWDEPSSFAGQLIREQIYKGHPYSKNLLGTAESIKAITQKDLMDFYKKYITPQDAKIAIVGDLKGYDVAGEVEKELGSWSGQKVETLPFPELALIDCNEINYPINRDQVVLCYAGLSVDRKNPDYDKLVLFDQIFGHGALGSMHSKLFQLREQSGLFYTINGSLTANSDEQPGMVLVKTIVSLDRLKEAEDAIKNTIENVISTITADEFAEARHAIANSLMNNFESNGSIARAFLFLDRFGFPADYFDNRAEQLKKISLDSMKEAIAKVLSNDKMLTLRIGRVDKNTKA
ncbi:MAG: pitrilysin family protein, partial [Candidatus Babeliales bacterium]|nr:pitrilysin family protein [Candidatus Babeliales bacterium]